MGRRSTRKSGWLKLIAGILLGCLTAQGQTPPNGKKLLEAVAATYRNARSYDIEAVVTANPGGKAIRNVNRIVFQAPDNYRLEVQGKLTLLYRGEKEYRFTRDGAVAAPPLTPSGRSTPDLASRRSSAVGSTIGDFTRIADNLLSARVLRREDLDANGAPLVCWVVEASYGNTTFGGRKKTYWIGGERNVVLREVTEISAGHVHVERTMAVEKLLWNEDISASLFEIPIAPGMKRPDGTVQPASNGIVPPVPIGLNGVEGLQRPSQCYEPRYTDEAKLAGLESSIRVNYVIDEKGIPVEVHAANQLGLGLEEMAEACVARWRYSPAMKDGMAIAKQSSVVMTFQTMRSQSDWHLERAAFVVEEGVKRPVFRKAPYPAGTHFSPISTKVPLKMTIDEAGVPREVQVVGTADEKAAKEAMEIVSKWRFTPGERNRAAGACGCGTRFGAGATNTALAARGNSQISSQNRVTSEMF